MKQTLLTTALLITTVLAFAQAPQGINYQAVVRDAGGTIIPSQNVTLRFGILETSPNGTVVYQEMHLTTTNALGLVNLQIGNGVPTIGTFPNVDWGSDAHYLKTELDAAGGSNFTILGTQQMISVPYALYAETAGSTPDTTHYVGEFFGGGIVAEVWNNGQNGLILSLDDLYGGQSIGFGDSAQISSLSLGSYFDGSSNTSTIVSALGTNSGIPYAAKECSDYTSGGFTDWFLPAAYHFSAIANNFYVIQRALETDGNPNSSTMTGSSYLSSTVESLIPVPPFFNYTMAVYSLQLQESVSPFNSVLTNPQINHSVGNSSYTYSGKVRACREF
jgi:hypothetical protein